MFPALLSVLDGLTEHPALVALVMGGSAWAESTLGLGVLVPGETLVALGAGSFDRGPVLWLLWLIVAAGAFLGDHVGYLVGRRAGSSITGGALVRKAGVHRLDRATMLVERHGAAVLVLGRLVPGVRTLLALAAGALGMHYRRYVVAAAAAALLWSAVWVGGAASLGPLVLAHPLPALALGGVLALLVVVLRRTGRRASRLAVALG